MDNAWRKRGGILRTRGRLVGGQDRYAIEIGGEYVTKSANADMSEYWNGVGGQKWLRFHLVIAGVLGVVTALHVWSGVYYGLRWFQ